MARVDGNNDIATRFERVHSQNRLGCVHRLIVEEVNDNAMPRRFVGRQDKDGGPHLFDQIENQSEISSLPHARAHLKDRRAL